MYNYATRTDDEDLGYSVETCAFDAFPLVSDRNISNLLGSDQATHNGFEDREPLMTHQINSLALRRGELALYKGQRVEIEAVLGFDTVQIRDLVTGGRLEVEISHLSRRDSEVDSATDQTDFKLTGKWREIAEFRLEVIKPLLNSRDRTRADVEARATEFNYRPNALYKWIAAYEGDGTLSSLGRKQRSDTSKTTFDARTEDLISNTFKELKPRDKHFTDIYKTIRDKIAAKNAQEKANTKNSCCDGSFPGNFKPMEIPSIGTVRNRFHAITRRQRYSQAHDARAAEHQFDPILGRFPGANCPLDVVQIDHTLLDIMLVDEKHRKPIKGP